MPLDWFCWASGRRLSECLVDVVSDTRLVPLVGLRTPTCSPAIHSSNVFFGSLLVGPDFDVT
jgi:hypothetical protein